MNIGEQMNMYQRRMMQKHVMTYEEALAFINGASEEVAEPLRSELFMCAMGVMKEHETTHAYDSLPEANMTFKQAKEFIFRFHRSYTRMQPTWDFRKRMERDEWLRLLASVWVSADNAGLYAKRLKRVLGSKGPLLPMMNAKQKAAYSRLPELVTVYRGCSKEFVDGGSWTLNADVAKRFPFLERYKARTPVLVTATVRKANILACLHSFKELHEEEVLTFSAKPVSIVRLKPTPTAD